MQKGNEGAAHSYKTIKVIVDGGQTSFVIVKS